MVVGHFDFSWGNGEYHQETLEKLKKSMKNTKKLCDVSLKAKNKYLTFYGWVVG